MRKRNAVWLLLVTAIIGGAMCSPQASAALLLYEGFDYQAGSSVSGQTNPGTGTGWSTATSTTNPPTVTAGSLTHPFAPSTGNSAIHDRSQTGFTRISIPGGPYTSGTLYYSMVFSLSTFATSPANLSQDGSFFAGFNNGTGTDAVGQAADQAGQILIRKEVVSSVPTGKVQFGVAKNNGSPRVFAPATFNVNDTVFAVVSYEFGPGGPNAGDDVARMWLNPVPGQPLGAPTVVSTVGPDIGATNVVPAATRASQLSSFYIRNNGVQPGNLRVDEIRIGTQIMNVIPEPATWSMMAAVGLFLSARRRRALN